MSGIFISYRRQDSAGHTGRLLDWLATRFSQEMIFRDLESIEPGEDFVNAIEQAIGSCEVLLAIIGKEWLTCIDIQGQKRLQNPDDLVHAEIKHGLIRSIPLIPVLVQGATMPPPSDLPDDLKQLAKLNSIELSDRRWQTDCVVLTNRVANLLHKVQPQPSLGRANQGQQRLGDTNVSMAPGSTTLSIGRGLRIENSTIGTIAAGVVRGNGLVHVNARNVSVLEGAEVKGSLISEIVGFKTDS